MQASLRLLKKRRFLPLFITQLLGAFNDNLFKNAMVLFVVYQVYNDERSETWFSALATGIFIIPFFLLSALSGQLADQRDKAVIIRWVKAAEIIIMTVGATGLALIWSGIAVHILAIPLLLAALFAMGIHSTFFGPIKYAILPQHLKEDEVLGGTGMVEAATYLSILLGTVVAGWVSIETAGWLTLIVAVIGWFTGRMVPAAPRQGAKLKLNFNPFTASWRLIANTMHIPRLFWAICAISFFWTMGAVLIVIFTPLAKNVLTSTKEVASLMIATFSVGVAIGSVIINAMLKGEISAKYSPISVIAMAVFIVAFSFESRFWIPAAPGELYDMIGFIVMPQAWLVLATLMAIAIAGGMFVVPLYAFLTTTVTKDQTARTVAANNIVNAFGMVLGALLVIAITALSFGPADQLLFVAGMAIISAWIAQRLHRACD